MKHGRVITGAVVVLIVLVCAGAGVWFLLFRHMGEQQNAADKGPWRHILTFDVTDFSREHKGDVGDRTIVIARNARPVGWEIGVYAYPVSEESDNLLYDGQDGHGPEPWQSFAWSKRKRVYPDTRIVAYGSPARKLKIVLNNCQTAKRGGVVVFTTGRIEVYHQP